MIKIKLYEKGSQKEKETIMKKVKDHLGNEFNSVAEMCRFHKIDNNLFNCRKRLGWDLKDILETPRKVRDRRTEYTDLNGNRFKTKTELANFHSMSDSRYYEIIKSGHSLEDDKNHKFGVGSCNVVADPFGKTHRTLQKMLEFYDIPKSSYFGYIVTGRTLKDLLIDKMNNRVQKFKRGRSSYNAVDHLGKVYESISDMCRHYRINIGTLKGRLLSGWNLEKALTYPVKDVDTEARKSEDHLGNRYNSIASMCKSYGLNVDTYEYRIKEGWTVEKALTTPVRPKRKYNRG